ncbi:MAG: hypothetical protein EXR68_00465 [Dehalococcoidia bacterium]|nr:hypothetical protein [Dehalococcoidia bacterium]
MPMEISRVGAVVEVSGSLDDPLAAARLAEALQAAVEAGHTAVELSVAVTGRRLPAVTAALASVCGYYRSQGIRIVLGGAPEVAGLAQQSFVAPPRATLQSLGEARDLFGRVWEFDREGADLLVEAFAGKAQERLTFAPGVFGATFWLLAELVENALERSDTSGGFIEAQANVSAQHLDLCVADYGRGLPAPPSFDGAVDRDGGLAGLTRLTALVNARARVVSGGTSFVIERGSRTIGEGITALPPGLGFAVDVQLGTGVPIELAEVVGAAARATTESPAAPVAITFRVAEHARGTATRFAAAEVRMAFESVLAAHGAAAHSTVALDFARCVVVSSAFADELVGPIVDRLGGEVFASRLRLIGMNEAVGAVVRHAVRLRMRSSQAS